MPPFQGAIARKRVVLAVLDVQDSWEFKGLSVGSEGLIVPAAGFSLAQARQDPRSAGGGPRLITCVPVHQFTTSAGLNCCGMAVPRPTPLSRCLWFFKESAPAGAQVKPGSL